MGYKTFVLDTNVFLHDPNALMRFENSEVIIPLTVLEELDKLKYFTDELGKNARHVIRLIDELKGNVVKGVRLSNGSKITLFVQNKFLDKQKFPFSIDSNKHRILFVAYQLKQEGREKVILISKDFMLRIKAESIGILVQDYEGFKEAYDTLYRGYREIITEKRHIDRLMTQGALDWSQGKWFPNEYCHFNSKEQASALGKYCIEEKCFKLLDSQCDDVWGIHPLNDQQRYAMDLLLNDQIKLVTLIGQAGTGKTLLALVIGLRKVFDESIYNRILITRPIMPLGKDIGYLPGTKEEKIYHWMQPIYDNLEFVCETCCGGENSHETKKWVMESEKIEMEAVTFIRGRSLAHSYIIIDEAQNLTPHEIKTIISRAGVGTKVILTGDPTQIDNPYLDKDSNALTYVVGKFKSYSIYGHMFFEKTERSPLAALAIEIL